MSIYVMSAVWKTGLPTNRKMVLLRLADAASDDGSNAFPSIKSLVKHTGVSRSTCKTILKQFRDEGIIEAKGKRRGGRGRMTNYTIYTDRAQALYPFPEDDDDEDDRGVVFQSAPPPQHEIIANVARALNAREQSKKGSTLDPFSLAMLKSLTECEKGSTLDPFPEKGSIRNLKGSNRDRKGSTALTPNLPIEPSLEPSARARGASGADGSGAAAPEMGAAPDPTAEDQAKKPPPLIHAWRDEIEPRLIELLDQHRYDAWLKPLIPHEVTEECYTLACPNPFILGYVKDNFDWALRAATGKKQIELIVTKYARFQYDELKKERDRRG